MGTPEGKIQIIDTEYLKKNLNTVKKHAILRKFRNIGSRVLGCYPRDNILGLGEPYQKILS